MPIEGEADCQDRFETALESITLSGTYWCASRRWRRRSESDRGALRTRQGLRDHPGVLDNAYPENRGRTEKNIRNRADHIKELMTTVDGSQPLLGISPPPNQAVPLTPQRPCGFVLGKVVRDSKAATLPQINGSGVDRMDRTPARCPRSRLPKYTNEFHIVIAPVKVSTVERAGRNPKR
ncbi:hypothetical protein F4780DRAFT_297666 [Xylariomycetidae sp. FL0641]|nr:hypothetical protein F4780DRAFT_297666 [Xylariomycetidae sp. FL0641]